LKLRKLFILSVIGIFSTAILAQAPVTPNLTPSINQTILAKKNVDIKRDEYYEAIYKKAYHYESLRMFDEAQQEYLLIAKRFLKKYSQYKNKKRVYSMLPISISSVFRLSIVTSKKNHFSTQPLIYRMKSYDETEDLINQYLQTLIDIRNQDKTIISQQPYGLLLFARANNNLAKASTILEGIGWKNYIVYPISDLIGALDKSIEDLKKQLMFEEIPYQQIKSKHWYSLKSQRSLRKFYEKYLEQTATVFKSLDPQSKEFKTYQYISLEDNPSTLAIIHAKRYCFQSYAIINYYQSRSIQAKIKKAKKLHSLDQILSKDSEDFRQVIEEITDLIGIK
jgi:hypothetical protein